MVGNTDKSKRIFFANINKCDISLTRYIKNEKLEPTINLISIKNNKILNSTQKFYMMKKMLFQIFGEFLRFFLSDFDLL